MLRKAIYTMSALAFFSQAFADGIAIAPDTIQKRWGSVEKRTLNVDANTEKLWTFRADKRASVGATLAYWDSSIFGVSAEIDIFPLGVVGSDEECVFRTEFIQIDSDGKETNRLWSAPVRVRLSGNVQTIELESCYFPQKNLPIVVRIIREAEDVADSYKGDVVLKNIRLNAVKKLPEPLIVEDRKGYNSWPMMQALGEKLVCVYSRGTGHLIGEGTRGAFVRTSTDRGKTWSAEKLVADDAKFGEVPIGKGLDSNGDMLLWVRAQGNGVRVHNLYRTKNGEDFELISTPKFSPMPMQITDIFHVENVGLMGLWFTGNYGKDKLNAWGTLISTDNGKTWTQRTIEDNLDRANWATEPSAVYLGNGKIFCIARTEYGADTTKKAQFQIESTDYGKTWKRSLTNITDVLISTPSLIYDKSKGLISNYYYQRGRGMLKRRVAKVDKIWGNPLGWEKPEIIAFASAKGFDAGNVNATIIGDTHYLAYYSGDRKQTSVVITPTPEPEK